MTKRELEITKQHSHMRKQTHNYWVYILTNPMKTVLYIGVTNNLKRRLTEHWESWQNQTGNFTSKYFCYHLVYYELFQYIDNAIKREKQLKKWSRIKKENLIESFNPEWKFLEMNSNLKKNF